MPNLNLPFDAMTQDEVVSFIQKYIVPLSPEEQSRLYLKANDLLAEIGMEWLRDLHARIISETGITFQWMIDGKWFDIPNTVAHYVERLEWLPVAYYTVHASGGPEMIRAAKKAAPDIRLLAITVLTSMTWEEVVDIYDWNRAESILRLAKSALGAWADGLVCSPADVPMLRAVFGNDFLLVTPNISREWVARQDDQNTALTSTPAWAILNGASDIVVGRPIFQAENPTEVIREMLAQMDNIHSTVMSEKFLFEKCLHRSDWWEFLRYAGVLYQRPENGKYVRWTSGLIADTYNNIAVAERDYRIFDRACRELSHAISAKNILPDIVMGAQMWSVRISLFLARALRIHESIYTEKESDSMTLKRHDIGSWFLQGKKVIISEDVISKASTIKKMIELVKQSGWEVVAITCIVNYFGQDNYEGIPLFYCSIPPAFQMWWDEKTLEKTRSNEIAAWKTLEQAEESVKNIQLQYPPLPEGSTVSEKPKNEWRVLVESMRK